MSGDLPLPPPRPDLCAVCGTDISRSEPDVILLHREVGEQIHMFHESCSLPAYQLVEDDPQTWGLIHRPINSDAN
jgi:hypothetical protein